MYTPSGVAASWPLGRKVRCSRYAREQKVPVNVVAKMEFRFLRNPIGGTATGRALSKLCRHCLAVSAVPLVRSIRSQSASSSSGVSTRLPSATSRSALSPGVFLGRLPHALVP